MSIIEEALKKARKEAEKPGATPLPEKPATRPADSHARPDNGQAQAAREFPPPRVAGGAHMPFAGEEYRLLKERLLSISSDKGMNLFMITSPMRNEGKTQVACSLALSLAQDFDHTTLLIDADLRSPACHKRLGLTRGAGLVDCLHEEISLEKALVRTGTGALSFLSAGRPAANLAELFSSNRMRELLHEIKHRYHDRLIIIDSSPLLPFAESRAISRVVDGVMMVARENVTLKAHLESALRFLQGGNVLGLVYNDAGNFGADKEIFSLSYSY